MKLSKHSANPILLPHPDHPWENLVVCNPGVIHHDGVFHMLYRAAGNDEDHVIYFGLATSKDGFHFDRAGTLPVLSPKHPPWLAVTDVMYVRHEKAGGLPSLRVTYRCGLTAYSEWVCFEHSGYARRKAEEWWQLRAPGTPFPVSVAEALARRAELSRPSAIMVETVGRFFEVKRARFESCPAPASAPSATGKSGTMAGSMQPSPYRTPAATPAGNGSAAGSARTSVTGGKA